MSRVYKSLHRFLAILGLVLGLVLGLSFPSFAQDPHAAEGVQGHSQAEGQNVYMPDCGQTIVDKALALKTHVEEANAADLEFLWSLLNSKLEKMSWDEKKALIDRIIPKILADKTTLMKLKEALDKKEKFTPDWGSFPLRTSLTKLIGTEKESGILDDVIALLSKKEEEGNPFAADQIGKLKPAGNSSTVLKTLLVYANLVLRDHQNLNALVLQNDFDRKVRICYPTAYPSHLEGEDLRKLGLYCEAQGMGSVSRIYVPNSGYIYGGNFFEGQCRGIDCSSFVAYCTQSAERLWTDAMRKIAEYYLIPEDKLTPEQKAEREADLKTEWFPRMLKEFEAVDYSKHDIKAGDVVVWKGHTAIYLGPSQMENHFVGIEANRTDDKAKEGIVVENMPFRREASPYTYVIRRRSFSRP